MILKSAHFSSQAQTRHYFVGGFFFKWLLSLSLTLPIYAQLLQFAYQMKVSIPAYTDCNGTMSAAFFV